MQASRATNTLLILKAQILAFDHLQKIKRRTKSQQQQKRDTVMSQNIPIKLTQTKTSTAQGRNLSSKGSWFPTDSQQPQLESQNPLMALSLLIQSAASAIGRSTARTLPFTFRELLDFALQIIEIFLHGLSPSPPLPEQHKIGHTQQSAAQNTGQEDC